MKLGFKHGKIMPSRAFCSDENQGFPLTKFVPWAAYYQDSNGQSHVYEQSEIYYMLMEQSDDNPDQINFEEAISQAHLHMEIVIADPFH